MENVNSTGWIPQSGSAGLTYRYHKFNGSLQGSYVDENFIANPLTTVTPIADKATVRCCRRLTALVSASSESLIPAYVNAASEPSIERACNVRSTRP